MAALLSLIRAVSESVRASVHQELVDYLQPLVPKYPVSSQVLHAANISS